MIFQRFLTDMVTVEFSSADPENTLRKLTLEKIAVTHIVQKHELTYQIQIRRRDYRRLSNILQKQEEHPTIINKFGLYWSVRSILHRPILLFSILFLSISSLFLPSRIFFCTVHGTETIPERVILSAAETCGIRFGASRKMVRSEKLKNELLSAVPQLQWAGINTYGCTAVISVRERIEEHPAAASSISHVIADRDGYILSTTITSGTAQISPGQTVRKGQLLICGYMDCGIYIRTSRAEGEILAQTQRNIQVVMPKKHYIPVRKEKPYYSMSFLIGKKRINLWKDSRISGIGYDRMYEEYYVSLPGGFQLPFAICIDRYFPYDLQPKAISENDALLQMQKFSENYLKHDMISGQILQSQHHFQSDSGLYHLQSNYTCTEMIGKERREEIGVMNGKRY